jgi:hypothetical protein
MGDDNFWHLGGVARWKLPIFNTYLNVSRHHFCCFIVVPLFFWISLWLRIGVYNTLASIFFCKIAQASKNSDSNAQHFLSDLLTHSWVHSMLFALPRYQFPYIVMNRCLYLRGASIYGRRSRGRWFSPINLQETKSSASRPFTLRPTSKGRRNLKWLLFEEANGLSKHYKDLGVLFDKKLTNHCQLSCQLGDPDSVT